MYLCHYKTHIKNATHNLICIMALKVLKIITSVTILTVLQITTKNSMTFKNVCVFVFVFIGGFCCCFFVIFKLIYMDFFVMTMTTQTVLYYIEKRKIF